MTMSEEGGYLGAMTFHCLFGGAIERVLQSRRDDPNALHELQNLRATLRQADIASPSFLFDFTKILLSNSRLSINIQVIHYFYLYSLPVDDIFAVRTI
ncbi:unnamed protein product [Toxocara canis]|uniref:Uncharacterized protein n=1 Tax=Toxocara canis TaxID=6265 RepID=A0A183U0N4_TOXCA|nr:unnamed protein product [Toxocara canis]